MSLLELLVAMGILTIAVLGLTAGLITASTSNAFAAKRTQTSAFGASRLDRLSMRVRDNIANCFKNSTVTVVDCSAMNSGNDFRTDAARSFENLAPGTGGWMLDVVDGAPGASGGDDLMFGPALVFSDSNIVDTAKTIALRAALMAEWTGGTTLGCGSTLITSNPGALCREVHIEQFTTTVTATSIALPLAARTVSIPLTQAWVRVVRGGANPRVGALTLDRVISQQW